MGRVELRLDKVEQRLDKVELRLDKVEQRLDKVEQRLDKVEQRLDKVELRLDKVEQRLDRVEQRLDKVEENTTELQLTLENETNRNIRIIAEGHLDLSRQLDDALRVESEKEMLLVRMNWMETEMRRMKKQIEAIA